MNDKENTILPSISRRQLELPKTMKVMRGTKTPSQSVMTILKPRMSG